jgi:glycerophosphoryl diester phosphodiesterase
MIRWIILIGFYFASDALTFAQVPPLKHAMIVIGDPQVYKTKDVDSVRIYMEDVRQYIQSELKDYAVHGLITGDMTGDQPQLLQALSKVFAETGIRFHYVKGNHDLTFGARSNDGAAADFKRQFGPSCYSFNVGKVHYVVLDNVFYLGHGHEYVGYLPEAQFSWLEHDLKSVPAGSTVVVALHIPTTHKAFRKVTQQQVMRNGSHLYELLKPYQVHIISGHTHLQDRHQPAPHVREHTQASLSGIFWQGPDAADGTPAGYSVFRSEGDAFSWHYKAIGKPASHQFRAYAVGENPERPDDLTALVWNWDPSWEVRWYEDGVYKGLMTNYIGRDPETTREIIANKASYEYDWIWSAETDHLFYARPEKASSEIEVEVVDEFGNIYREKLPQVALAPRITMDNYLISLDKRGAVVGTVLTGHSNGGQIKLLSDTARLFRIDRQGRIALRKGKKIVAGGTHAFGIMVAVGGKPWELELVKDEFLRNKVIAHRGAWRKSGVMQNSIRSFQHAVDLRCEGSEFDVWLSKDKEVVLSHDPHIGGLTVEESTAAELHAATLASGDPVPTLKDLIHIAKQQNRTKMILEIKPSPTGRNPELVDSVLSVVHRLKAQGYIEYISFDYDVLKRIKSRDPSAITAYLTGDKPVTELASDGINVNYDFYKYQADPDLPAEAKRRGLSTNVWTVNDEHALRTFLQSGVDRITTDEPELLMNMINHENRTNNSK